MSDFKVKKVPLVIGTSLTFMTAYFTKKYFNSEEVFSASDKWYSVRDMLTEESNKFKDLANIKHKSHMESCLNTAKDRGFEDTKMSYKLTKVEEKRVDEQAVLTGINTVKSYNIQYKNEDMRFKLLNQYLNNDKHRYIMNTDATYTEIQPVINTDSSQYQYDIGKYYETDNNVYIEDISDVNRFFTLVVSNGSKLDINRSKYSFKKSFKGLNSSTLTKVNLGTTNIENINIMKLESKNNMPTDEKRSKFRYIKYNTYYHYQDKYLQKLIKELTGNEISILLKFRKTKFGDNVSIYNKGMQIDEIHLYCKQFNETHITGAIIQAYFNSPRVPITYDSFNIVNKCTIPFDRDFEVYKYNTICEADITQPKIHAIDEGYVYEKEPQRIYKNLREIPDFINTFPSYKYLGYNQICYIRAKRWDTLEDKVIGKPADTVFIPISVTLELKGKFKDIEDILFISRYFNIPKERIKLL